MRSVARDENMPAMSTLFKWLSEYPEFAEQYAKAKVESADAFQDKINDVSDGVLDGRYEPAAARVAMDGYKWTASKLKPKKYGDRMQLAGDPESPLNFSHLTDEELDAKIREYLDK